ncbi:hypothetical protein [Thauera aromatica]|uniref:hypothetical protein n=1 Tax=Thauera aromatica TaxID=59405 RepID=UPI001FFC8CB7|nr:hypothetical protein [Thauera aromatica]MCK2097471.1 hypothetical protein [Thauera aromatica]
MFWKILGLVAIALFGMWVFNAQESAKARSITRAQALETERAQNDELFRRGAIVRSERKYEGFSLRTIEMPRRSVIGAEIVTCLLFQSETTAALTCGNEGEPVFD